MCQYPPTLVVYLHCWPILQSTAELQEVEQEQTEGPVSLSRPTPICLLPHVSKYHLLAPAVGLVLVEQQLGEQLEEVE